MGSEELYDLYNLLNTIRVIKSRRMRQAGLVACARNRRVAYRVLMRKPEGKVLLRRPRRR